MQTNTKTCLDENPSSLKAAFLPSPLFVRQDFKADFTLSWQNCKARNKFSLKRLSLDL